MKHWHLIAALTSILSTSAMAQSVSPSMDLPLLNKTVDLASVVNNMHACYVFDQHRSHLAGAYLPGLNLHTASGVEMASLNVGAIWQADNGVGGPMVAVGIRFDNLAQRAYGNSWVATHTSMTKLPAVEVGPFGGWIGRLGWLYGLFVSAKVWG